MIKIRLATLNDAEAILAIYSPYISNTSFTFETEIPSTKEFQKRISDYQIQFPWLVCEINGVIAGYAYGNKYRERTAYQWCVESSIYVHNDFQKQNIGKALYTALIEIVKQQGFRNLYAVINLPNDKSVRFHESCGFSYFATYYNVGYKLGQWKNVGWWQLILNEFGMEPEPPKKISELNKDFLADCFAKSSLLLKK